MVDSTCDFDIVDVNAVNNNMASVLDGNLGTHNMNLRATAIDGFERVDPKLPGEGDGHVLLEDDPQRGGSRDAVPESARRGMRRVVGAVGDCVEAACPPSFRVPAEPRHAGSECFPVTPPVRVAAPAVVDRVACSATPQILRERLQHGVWITHYIRRWKTPFTATNTFYQTCNGSISSQEEKG